MPFKENLEQEIQKNEMKLHELILSMKKLDTEFNFILNDLGISVEQLHSFIKKNENSTLPIWETLRQEKKKLDEKLDLSLKNVKDPVQLQKTFSEIKSIQPHWILVR